VCFERDGNEKKKEQILPWKEHDRWQRGEEDLLSASYSSIIKSE
jgi:hypothetical protein